MVVIQYCDFRVYIYCCKIMSMRYTKHIIFVLKINQIYAITFNAYLSRASPSTSPAVSQSRSAGGIDDLPRVVAFWPPRWSHPWWSCLCWWIDRSPFIFSRLFRSSVNTFLKTLCKLYNYLCNSLFKMPFIKKQINLNIINLF